MGGQRRLPGFAIRGWGFGLLCEAHRAPPLVEDIEHVRFAEVDLHRTPSRSLSIVALEVAIDPLARNFERHALRRPAGHEIERRSGDADQMPVVLPAEVNLDGLTELRDRRSAIVDRRSPHSEESS